VNCRDVGELVHAFADDELDLVSARQVEEHLSVCGGCRRRLDGVRAVKTAVSNGGQYFKAPEGLRGRVLAELERGKRKEEGKRGRGGEGVNGGAVGGWRIGRGFWSIAVAALVVLAVGVAVEFRGSRIGETAIAAEVLTAHLRSLQPGHLMDVVSTDQHTVKPWFDTRIDFSPPVKQLESAGFPLIGGRLDYLENRPVAALVYGHGKHLINVFVWPGEDGNGSSEERGFHFVHWAAGGMTFWAVSDLNAADLERFSQLVREEVVSTKPVN